MTKKLSIIVPVYNVEKYIRPCIESIFLQGLKEDDFEVIIVNDGSKDHSMEVIQDIISLHQNITIINQENQGLSVARNNGIEIAKGEYLLMPDSDDVLITDSLKPLLEIAFESKADLVVADFLRRNEDEMGLPISQDDFKTEEKSGERLFTEDLVANECNVWRTLYRRVFLSIHHISFQPGIAFEDLPFTFECFLKAKKCIRAHWLLYIYRRRPYSLCAHNSFNMKKAHDFCVALSKTWQLRNLSYLSKEQKTKLNDLVFDSYMNLLYRTLYIIDNNTDKVEIIKMIQTEVSDLKFTHGLKQKAHSFFYRTSPRLYIGLLLLKKRLFWSNHGI